MDSKTLYSLRIPSTLLKQLREKALNFNSTVTNLIIRGINKELQSLSDEEKEKIEYHG